MASSSFLAKIERVASLSNEERQLIDSLPMTVKALGRGQDVVREGDLAGSCCLVLDGWVCRYKLLDDGRRQIFAFHIPGDFPDLQSLYLDRMDHSICALTPCRVGFIPHRSVKDLIANIPTLTAILWRETLIDAAIFREWMIGIGRRSAMEGIAHLFCELYAKLRAASLARDLRCRLPITQTDIADALGLTSVHVNRSLQELRSQRMITLSNGILTIDNWSRLQQLAGFDPGYLNLLDQQVAA